MSKITDFKFTFSIMATYQRPLDSRTRTSTTSSRFDLKFFPYSQNIDSRKASFYHFPPEKLALLPLVKEVTPSPDRKMIKLLTFDNLFSHFDILAKTRSRMTAATTFSLQSDAGSRASSTYY